MNLCRRAPARRPASGESRVRATAIPQGGTSRARIEDKDDDEDEDNDDEDDGRESKGTDMVTATRSRAVLIDLGRCVACKTCELACAKAHAGFRDIVDALLAEAHLVPRVRVVSMDGRNVPVICRHCEDAACVTACPTDALSKEEDSGRVLFTASKCISCRACVRVCPYAAVFWDERGEAIVKCDVCEGLIEDGEDTWCVRACPTSALSVVSVSELHEAALSGEYDALVKDESRRCLAGPDVTFEINQQECICCGRCAKNCPVDCISGKAGKPPAKAKDEDRQKGKVGQPFKINQEKCVHCGTCHEVCPVGAVKRN
jgi:carbon-monoxide dehydrogenase iron sulfur subunit